MKKILIIFAILFTLVLANMAAQSSSLVITGFPGYAEYVTQ